MKLGDRIFYLERSYYGELQESSGMVIRVQGNGFNKTVTFVDNAAQIKTIKMIDISDHESGHEVFFAEVSEFYAENFKTYPAGLRLQVIALVYSKNRRSSDADLLVLSPNETIKTHILSSHLLCCDGEDHSMVFNRAMRVLPGYESGMNRRGSHVGKERDAVWRMAKRTALQFRDGKLKKMDPRLGLL
ncbi:hypothetical protein [Acidithiobacillus sulfurivorans]|uniref:Uncharacterized protein n=1 Tax=Acidithiobacillus sulfurivorans TaxID=1958756 RepID=A0ABS5ZX01_9PROT|nr:hypothetical protein [Acidithiobacillus sulfurivorans]MBU2759704.1 hypothetical protein [Acidithiobacillus sulfurivorans]